MQTFETLMLRLTTNVTVVAGQLGAQLVGRLAHVLDRLRARLGEQRGQLVLGDSHAPSRPCAIAAGDEVAADRRGSSRRPEPRRGMNDQYFVLIDVEHALRDPLGVDVLRVDAQPLGQRDAVGGQALAHLVRRRERVLGRDVVAVGAQPAEVGRARGDELGPPVGEVRRDLDADVRAAARAPRRRAASCPRSSPATPTSGAATSGRVGRPVRQYASAASVAISAGSSP